MIPLFILLIQELNKPTRINQLIVKEAKGRKLKSITIQHPQDSDWNKNPFDNRIRIGRSLFNAIPSDQEYYRIVIPNNDTSSEVWWVRAMSKSISNKINLEWRKEKQLQE